MDYCRKLLEAALPLCTIWLLQLILNGAAQIASLQGTMKMCIKIIICDPGDGMNSHGQSEQLIHWLFQMKTKDLITKHLN